MTDAVFDENYVTDLRNAMRDSKGLGSFRNLFMYAPSSKKGGIQLIPISEVVAKDDFGAIKNISRDDQLAMLPIPPQLMGGAAERRGLRLGARCCPGVGRQRTGAVARPAHVDQ